jgi:hypothetical protein
MIRRGMTMVWRGDDFGQVERIAPTGQMKLFTFFCYKAVAPMGHEYPLR